MKRKTIYEAMKAYVEVTLNETPTDLITIAAETSVDKETGEVTNFVKTEAEVPKGYDTLSRCRFTVKIVDAPLKVTETQLEDNDYDIADSYEVKAAN